MSTKKALSGFTLTFAVEIVNLDVWDDCSEGWFDLGTSVSGLKLQYQLYFDEKYEIDILIWPHAAKITCGSEVGWVRTWLYLNRRWFTFSIRHCLHVRVLEFQKYDVVISPISHSGAKISAEVYVLPLAPGEKRYFGKILPVLPSVREMMIDAIREIIWSCVESYIPRSDIEGKFNIPTNVTDTRHQDTIMEYVQNFILYPSSSSQSVHSESFEHDVPNAKTLKAAKSLTRLKNYELKLTGNAILAGVGRVIPFEASGHPHKDLGPVIAIISSINLPAPDDLPVLFVNVDNLCDVPLEEMRKLGIASLYTSWMLGDVMHNSEPMLLTTNANKDLESGSINFKDHFAIPMPPSTITEVTSTFLDNPYQIQLRGIIKTHEEKRQPKLFGYETHDRLFSNAIPLNFHLDDKEEDYLIAVTDIDAKQLSRGFNTFIRGEYPLQPLITTVVDKKRETVCTNDINYIRAPVGPKIVVPTDIILRAFMTLEVSMGVVGCKPHKPITSYSGLYAMLTHREDCMKMVTTITRINEETSVARSNELLTGFAIDTGGVCLLYVEGPRDGTILQVWQLTADFHNRIKCYYSSSARYSTRIYEDSIRYALPFVVLKMHAPIGLLLACPAIYVRPALPLPARSALLKLDSILKSQLLSPPPRHKMPTNDELRSLRLEMCTPPRPPLVKKSKESDVIEKMYRPASSSRINWAKND